MTDREMDRHSMDEPWTTLSRLVESITRPARVLLLLDEDLPTDLRVAAMTMPAERLFWTLTQLDDGLDLDTCQALVRASRLRQGPWPADPVLADDVAAAEAAATTAAAWLRGQWASMPDLIELVNWFHRPSPAPAPTSWTRAGALPGELVDDWAAPRLVAVTDHPGLEPVLSWLDAPPLVGPPPVAPSTGLSGWPLVRTLRRAAASLAGRVRKDDR